MTCSPKSTVKIKELGQTIQSKILYVDEDLEEIYKSHTWRSKLRDTTWDVLFALKFRKGKEKKKHRT